MKRTMWMAAGLVIGLLVALTAQRAAAKQADAGRYSMSTQAYGNSGHAVVVVLDSATGQVTPYVIHTNNSLSAGDLRLTQIRTQ